MNQKFHAILVLMEEHKDDMAQGMGISPDLVVKALELVHRVRAYAPRNVVTDQRTRKMKFESLL